MARKNPNKPRPLNLDAARARAVRGPHKDGSGRWYWRADMYVGEGKRTTIWTGWASREEVRQQVSALLAQAKPIEAAEAARAARASEVQTVRDLLEVYLGHEQTRVALWRQEEETGEAAVAAGAARRVLHSKDALAPSTFAGKRSTARQIARRMGDRPLGSLTRDDLLRYKVERLDEAASGTVRNELKVLKGAWAWGARDGRDYTSGLTMRWPDVPMVAKRAKYTPSRGEVNRIIDAMPPGWQRDLVTVQSILGSRIGALARLTRGDVDLERGTVRLKIKRHDRTVRVPDEVLAILQPYVAMAEHGTIWPATEHTAREVCKRVKGKRVNVFADACDRAGVQHFTSHALRRMVCNEWIAAGVNVAVYARVLGHSPEEALRAYAAIQGDDELAAFRTASKVAQDNVRLLGT